MNSGFDNSLHHFLQPRPRSLDRDSAYFAILAQIPAQWVDFTQHTSKIRKMATLGLQAPAGTLRNRAPHYG